VTTPIAPLLAWAPRDAANRDLPERWHVPRSACPLKPMPSSVETLEKRIERRSHLRLMTETRLAARRRRPHLSRALLRSSSSPTARRRRRIEDALIAVYCVFVGVALLEQPGAHPARCT
jgi:hypothetical protein